MHNIKAIVFDLGRVLVDVGTKGEKFGALMRSFGINPEEAFDKFWFTGEVRQHMTGELDSRGFYDATMVRFNTSWSYEEFSEAWCDLFQPRPEMEALFSEIAARYRVGLLSDTDPLHWAALRSQLAWLDRIEHPTLSFDVGYLKPHPKMFAAAAANCGVGKEECLFIDDLLENVDGARYSGMPALLFSSPAKLRKDLLGLRVL